MTTYSKNEEPGRFFSDERPHWLIELDRTLGVLPQFILTGNIRDVFLLPNNGSLVLDSITGSLWRLLTNQGYDFVLVYDPVEGIRVIPESARSKASLIKGLNLPQEGSKAVSLEALTTILGAVTHAQDVNCAFIIDYASRLLTRPDSIDPNERAFFTYCEKLAHETREQRSPNQRSHSPYNPIIWLVNRPNDLPDWFMVGNESIRQLVVGLPDRQTRAKAAVKLTSLFSDSSQLESDQRESLTENFADLTEGLTLRSMASIARLARNQKLPLTHIVDAVRGYKVGIRDNPWKKNYLKDKIRNGHEIISNQVLGQSDAVRKALDILTRSVMGLSGAQATSQVNRPRGVLFLAGPTGVGKTELAKAITRLIFGDEQAYTRFDMSEFAAEHSDARLIGAPPGYIGYDSGGELVNAIRQRPFSVLLFDEIEKAHPRILDKFLQILEDGRLTDGRGDTVYFSETIIIFTSNLGIYVDKNHKMKNEENVPDQFNNNVIQPYHLDQSKVLNVSPEDSTEKVKIQILTEIKRYFRSELQRPELLNRIGDNIVVFDFIRPDVAENILDRMVSNVLKRVEYEHDITINISLGALESLKHLCTDDLMDGGRGIGNMLESTFINPLARALFDYPLSSKKDFTIKNISSVGTNYSLDLS